jgi:hypothetical protein
MSHRGGQPTTADEEQLRILAICTLVYACTIGLASIVVFFCYVCIALAAMADADDGSVIAGGIVFVLGLVVSGLFFAKSALMVFSAIGLFKRTWRGFSYAMAGLSCMNVPIGTALGVFTFVVLDRPGVRALYEGRIVARPTPVVPMPPPPQPVVVAYPRVRVAV